MQPVIVILGPTASGKTGVAIEIAEEIARRARMAADGKFCGLRGAEVISADSRAIYKEMDLGTAKPSPTEQTAVPHCGIDLVRPGERFTAADFKTYAETQIAAIRARGNLPMVVGGTGLYIDALVYNYHFDEDNKITQADRQKMQEGFVLVGIQTEPAALRQRIEQRANKLFTQELYDETRQLVERYGWDNQAMTSNIYQFAWGYLTGKYSLEEAKKLFVLDDWHLAKRQMTWFRRNKKINWMPLDKVRDFVLKCIQDDKRNE